MFRKFQITTAILLSLLVVACGEKEKLVTHSITDVEIETTIENNEHYLNLTANVGGPGLYFNGDLLGVHDPLTAQQLGSILVLNGENEKNKLRLKINFDQLKIAHSLNESLLPNQSPFPTIDYDSVLVLPAGEHSRVYLLKKDQNYSLGLAVVIPEFDQLIHQISTSNLVFNLEDSAGVGGFFTSKEKFQSGMMIFKPLSLQKQKWQTRILSDKKFEILFKQIHAWQKKKTKFRIK